MLSCLLVVLDDSAGSAAALELGIRWAQRFQAELVGMAIVDEPGIRAVEPAWPVGGEPGKDPVYYLGYEEHLKQARQRAEQVLEQSAARCAEAGVRHTAVSVVGRPDQQIELEAQAHDLILLGRGAHFHVTASDAPDDTPSRVLKNAPRPLVIVPAAPPPDGPVVIAYDGSLQAARALASFLASGLSELGQVHVVAVAGSVDRANHLLEPALRDLQSHGIAVTAHPLASSDPHAEVILDLVRQLAAGLLVMGAYGQPVLREFFIGSATRTALKESPAPLFLAH
jgi:nucleotide-binding universal stress UspA family protein